MVTIAEYESILRPDRKHNYTKARCLTALSMYSALGYPWTTAHDLRAALGMPHSLLTLLGRWVDFKYIKRRGDPGYYEYCLAQKGRAWLESLSAWWPEYKHRVPIEADQRVAAVDGVRRTVAEASGIVVWWAQYSHGQAWNIHSIRGPFLTADDYQYHRQRVAMDNLRLLFNSDYLLEGRDAMSALTIIDKLGMPPGRRLIERMVEVGLLTWG